MLYQTKKMNEAYEVLMSIVDAFYEIPSVLLNFFYINHFIY